MHLLKTKTSNGKTYLRLARSFRKNGKVKKEIVENLGYLEDLQAEYDDPIAHFEQIAKQRTEEDNKSKILADFWVGKDEETPSYLRPKTNIAIPVVLKIYNDLGIDKIFDKLDYSELELRQIKSLVGFLICKSCIGFKIIFNIKSGISYMIEKPPEDCFEYLDLAFEACLKVYNELIDFFENMEDVKLEPELLEENKVIRTYVSGKRVRHNKLSSMDKYMQEISVEERRPRVLLDRLGFLLVNYMKHKMRYFHSYEKIASELINMNAYNVHEDIWFYSYRTSVCDKLFRIAKVDAPSLYMTTSQIANMYPQANSEKIEKQLSQDRKKFPKT